jgi:hypothetical protein
VKFIEGPTLRIQRHQKVYLPPKKKTVVYILLKEPQIITDVEVVGPTEEPVPEVFITYQKSDGVVKTKHYSPEVVKNDKYLSQLRESAQSAMTGSSSSSGSFDNNKADSSSGSGSGVQDLLTQTGEGKGPTGPTLSQQYYGLSSFNVDEQQALASFQSQQRVKAPISPVHIRSVHGEPLGTEKTTGSLDTKPSIMCNHQEQVDSKAMISNNNSNNGKSSNRPPVTPS